VLNRYVHPRPMQENPKRWDLITLSRPYLPGANTHHLPAISSRSSRLIAALGIAEFFGYRSSRSSVLACRRSGVSKPSVNQP
jgi:hypothetical protein